MKRVLYLIFALFTVVALLPSCGEAESNAPKSDPTPIQPGLGGGGNEEPDNGGDEPEEETPREELKVDIPNWDFEEECDFKGTKGVWVEQSGWHGHNAVVTWEPEGGYKGSAGVKITCKNETTDKPIAQTVSGLQVGKLYELSAMVKTQGITKGWGGSVYHGLWGRSDKFTGTNSWKKRSLLFIPEEESITLGVRLGFSAGDSDGTAWFDNVKLGSPEGYYHRESEHVEIYLEEALVTVADTYIDKWMAKLDLAYEAYCELFPFFKPFKGRKMVILNDVIDAWAYAGYPILWNTGYVKSTLETVKNNNDTCFGLLHEMGHNFAPGNYRDGAMAETGGNYNLWNWNEELFANFRMYYALGRHNLPLYLDGKSYTGTSIDSKYRADSEKSWNENNDLDGAGMMWPLCQAVKKWGWEPFKATFEELYNRPQNESAGESKWSKIRYFFDVLSKHAGVEDALAEVLTQDQIDRLISWNQ